MAERAPLARAMHPKWLVADDGRSRSRRRARKPGAKALACPRVPGGFGAGTSTGKRRSELRVRQRASANAWKRAIPGIASAGSAIRGTVAEKAGSRSGGILWGPPQGARPERASTTLAIRAHRPRRGSPVPFFPSRGRTVSGARLQAPGRGLRSTAWREPSDTRGTPRAWRVAASPQNRAARHRRARPEFDEKSSACKGGDGGCTDYASHLTSSRYGLTNEETGVPPAPSASLGRGIS